MARRSYVIRTDKLGKPFYWCGIIEGNIGGCHSVSDIVFNAWRFTNKAEAETLIKDANLGDAWIVSEITDGGSIPKMMGLA